MPRRAPANRPPLRTGPPAPGPASHVDGVDLPLPHELDQSLNQVASVPDPMIEQAKRDLDAGLVDTDMRATPGLDATRRERMVPTPRAKPK